MSRVRDTDETGQIYEKVTGRTLGPSVSSRFAFEVSIPIELDWVESV
jgi:hypothetical protein